MNFSNCYESKLRQTGKAMIQKITNTNEIPCYYLLFLTFSFKLPHQNYLESEYRMGTN